MNKIKTRFSIRTMLCGLLACSMMSCADDLDIEIIKVKGQPYDSSKPVEVTDYTPKTGSSGQRMVIYGKNFGDDPSIIKVAIGGAEAVVVSSDGNAIYCLVPERSATDEAPDYGLTPDEGEAPEAQAQAQADSEGDSHTRTLSLVVGPTGAMKPAEFDSALGAPTFVYQKSWHVRTVAGYVNDKNENVYKEGPFSDCGNFANPMTFTADPYNPKHIYVTSDLYDGAWGRSDIRLLDFENKYVYNICTGGQLPSSDRIRGVSFTKDEPHDMLVAMDNGSGQPSILMIKRKGAGVTGKEAFADNATAAVGIAYTVQCNGVVTHPVSGSLFYNQYGSAEVWKFPADQIYNCLDYNSNHESHTSYHQYKFGETSWEFNLAIHPEGTYMIGVHINGSFLSKSMYNEETDTFGMPINYLGSHSTMGLGGGKGYVEDVGLSARCAKPRQGVFVKNPEYVAAGKSDVYDFYFTDSYNHCIRKVTPQGITSTFAGRGTASSEIDYKEGGDDVNGKGFADGLVRGEAMFNRPMALHYDEQSNVFWVGDVMNKRIREIYFE